MTLVFDSVYGSDPTGRGNVHILTRSAAVLGSSVTFASLLANCY